MQTENKILDDLARVATGALGALSGVREEVDAQLRQQFEKILDQMDLVTREEFEAVKAMAAKARAEQEALAARVAALEGQRGAGPEPTSAKPTGAKPTRAKPAAGAAAPAKAKRAPRKAKPKSED